jgi:hypothetical protein
MRNTFTSLSVTSKLDSQSDKERLRIVLGGKGSGQSLLWVSVDWNAKEKKLVY